MAYSRVLSAHCFGPTRDLPGWILRGLGGLIVLLWLSSGNVEAARAPDVFVRVSVPAEDEGGEDVGPDWAVANRVIVRVRPEALAAGRRLAGEWLAGVDWIVPRRRVALAAGGGAGVLEQLGVVRVEPGSTVERTLQALRKRPEVMYAEPVWRVRTAVVEGRREPDDFGFGRQWSLRNTGQTGGKPGADIHAPEAWRYTTGSSNVLVAVIDTGVDFFHPDLAANVWTHPGEIPGNGVDDDGNGYVDDVHGYDFVSDDGDPMDDNSHGTHVAGILGAVGNDGNGIAGVAWNVRILGLKALDDTGSGALDDILRSIAYARASGARVANASWGTTSRSRALDDAIGEAARGGMLVVAAAGNNGSDARYFPAATPEVIAVGATDARDLSPTFSNYGSFVDMVAPGDSIESTVPNAGWSVLSGTSMSAPHVSGVAALLLARRAEFTADEIGVILRSTAEPLETDRFTGAGRLDAGRAVAIGEPLPLAKLASAAVWSGRFDIRGTARGNGFAGWRLELGAGERPTGWEPVGAGGEPDVEGVLVADFDSARFDDGAYVVRLTVTNAAGQVAREQASLVIRNVEVESPRNNDVLRQGDRVEWRGTVFGAGRSFAATWGLGRNPAEWHTDGIEYGPAGQGQVVGGVLAYWDTQGVPSGSFVTLRLVARQGERIVGEAYTRMVHLEGRLRPGWPRRLPFTDEFPVNSWREFNVGDLDGDGRGEIVLVDHGESGGRVPRLMALGSDGSPRWTRELPAGAPEFDAPVIGDFDGDGRLEVVVDTGDGGWVSVFDAAGRPRGGRWPVAPGGTHFGKIMADLDGDGRDELILLSRPPPDLVSLPENQLIVLDGNGAVLWRWTVAACDEETLVPELLPTVANLDDDPELEIVAVNGCGGISAFKPSVPDQPLWTTQVEGNVFGSPVAGDLDGDGHEEIVLGASGTEPGAAGGLYVIEDTGRIRSGFPVLRERSFSGSAALADLNGDGRLEMVIADWDGSTVHVVGDDGFELPGWPLPTQVNAGTRSNAIVGDVDGDGREDVVVASPGGWLQVVLSGDTARAGGVKAWRADGSLIRFHEAGPMEGLVMESASGASWNRFPAAALADLDGDGRWDVVAGSVQDRAYSPTAPLIEAKMRSSLYAWALPVPVGRASWPMHHGGPNRAGRYVRSVPPNQAPRIVGLQPQTVAPGTAFRAIPLDLYVEDPDDRVTRLTWEARASGGLRVTVDAARVARIEPASADWVGRETVEFTVRDPRGGAATATVVCEVRPGYRPPVAVADVVTLTEDTEGEFDLLANDTSPTGRPLRLVAVSRPGDGVTRWLGTGRASYLPSTNFFGTDRFEYTIADDDGGMATGEVEVRVQGVNDGPQPVPDRVILEEDSSAEFSILENDQDPDGDPLTLVTLGAPEAGRLDVAGADWYRYTPPPDFHGLLTVPYVVRDGAGLVSTGEVGLLVKPVNDAPVVANQTVQLNRNRTADIIYKASDADGDTLKYTIVEGPTNGVLLAYPDLANYQPRKGFAGRDRFTYTASDGETTVGPATVSLEVEDANNAPDLEEVSTVTAQGQELVIGLAAVDPDGDAVHLRIDRGPRHGAATLEGTNLVYRPEPEFVGDDELTCIADDGLLTGEPAEVRIRVTDVNTPPVARSEVLTVGRDVSTPIVLRAVDGENNPLRYLIVSNVSYGVLAGDPPRMVYTPKSNFRGVDRLEFRVNDGQTNSEPAVVHLLVRDPNQPPVATNQTVEVVRGRPQAFRLEVTDADGQPLRAAILKGPRSGRVHGTGIDYTYAPRVGFTGEDSFTYLVWDGLGYSHSATVTLEVRAPTSPPPEVTSVRRIEAGVELTVSAVAGEVLHLEGSDDLVRWEDLGVRSNPNGVLRWLTPLEADRRARFFRVRSGAESGVP